ncbi:prepilin-type N-terminal cleavage/methylation domain-containing protein [Burkholderiales bacterium JOSHI_001]|nr:prepilin-type N-terminal cleavage/methylation domain-containing protein [Burkholderiales bacterium JOSHI_001]
MLALPRLRTGRGFTLVELLVSVAIVGVLASMVLPLAELTIRRQREADLRQSLREIRRAIDAYKQAADAGLIDRSLLKSGYPPSLQALVVGVPNRRDPGAAPLRFLRRVPRDPFAVDPALSDEQTWGLRSYASPHDKPQLGEDVFDVYSLAPGLGMNGVPFRQW